MLDRFNTNPTQLTGLLSFAAATTACLLAARRSRWREARFWWALALTNSIFFLDVLFGLRHHVHDYFSAILTAEGKYGQRREMQGPIIIVLGVTAVILVMLLLSVRRFSGIVRIAAGLTIALLALFAIETVSLHSLDGVYYQTIGPVMVIGWLWAIGAAGTCLVALVSLTTADRIPRPP
jgi:phosphoglycerol transferase MdoB-like AlkP superfamily enzyme